MKTARIAALAAIAVAGLTSSGLAGSPGDGGVAFSPASSPRLTLLGHERLTGPALKGAVDGVRVWVLVENPGTSPGFGEVRLTFRGAQYNPATNPASSNILAPDLIIYGGADFARQHPELVSSRPPMSPGALVGEFLIRGGRPVPDEKGTLSVELPSPDPSAHAGARKVRWNWYDLPYPG